MTVNDDGDVMGPTITLNIRYCERCNRNRVTRKETLCVDCRAMELQSSLMTRDDSQRRREWQTPEGHTLPQITVPMMGNQIQAPPVQPQISQQYYQPQAPVQQIPSNAKLDELRAKIEALKRQVTQ